MDHKEYKQINQLHVGLEKDEIQERVNLMALKALINEKLNKIYKLLGAKINGTTHETENFHPKLCELPKFTNQFHLPMHKLERQSQASTNMQEFNSRRNSVYTKNDVVKSNPRLTKSNCNLQVNNRIFDELIFIHENETLDPQKILPLPLKDMRNSNNNNILQSLQAEERAQLKEQNEFIGIKVREDGNNPQMWIYNDYKNSPIVESVNEQSPQKPIKLKHCVSKSEVNESEQEMPKEEQEQSEEFFNKNLGMKKLNNLLNWQSKLENRMRRKSEQLFEQKKKNDISFYKKYGKLMIPHMKNEIPNKQSINHVNKINKRNIGLQNDFYKANPLRQDKNSSFPLYKINLTDKFKSRIKQFQIISQLKDKLHREHFHQNQISHLNSIKSKYKLRSTVPMRF